jgi:hypothetical protein
VRVTLKSRVNAARGYPPGYPLISFQGEGLLPMEQAVVGSRSSPDEAPAEKDDQTKQTRKVETENCHSR